MKYKLLSKIQFISVFKYSNFRSKYLVLETSNTLELLIFILRKLKIFDLELWEYYPACPTTCSTTDTQKRHAEVPTTIITTLITFVWDRSQRQPQIKNSTVFYI